MPKKTTAVTKAEEKNTAVVVPDYGDYSGAGFENQTTDDIAIPFLALAQTNSPVANQDHDDYIEGCKAGSLFNTVTRDLFPAEGAVVVPCLTRHIHVEWTPREDGGGFVAEHAIDSDVVANRVPHPDPTKKNKWRTTEGNDLVETFLIYGLLLDSADAETSAMPIVISFTASKIKKYRQLMLKLRTVKGRPPLFAFRVVFTSKGEVAGNEHYKNFDINLVGGSAQTAMIDPKGPQRGLLDEGIALLEAVNSGAKFAAHDSNVTTGEGGDETEAF